jgi:hypothetical protein
MAELKTKQTAASVEKFLQSVADEQKRQDCRMLIDLMQAAVKAPPTMWGSSIIGFGNIHLKYASGRELDWFPIGFSPRKQNLVLYLLSGFQQQADLLAKLGKYKTGKGCLYVNRLADIDLDTLREILKRALRAPGAGR